jgi:MFS transporter, ACS family, D-galactonate transporter
MGLCFSDSEAEPLPPAQPLEPDAALPLTVSLRDSPRRWWLAALLTLGMVFCYAQRGALSVAAPFMMKERDLSPAAMGILLSAFFWSYAFMQVPAGWLVDHVGVKRAYAAGFVSWSLAAAATGLARRLAELALLRVALGVGQAVAFPASASTVAHSFRDEERGVVTAFYLSGVRLGQALVGAVGAVMIAAYGDTLFFVATGLVPMLWVVPWILFWSKREGRNPSPEPEASAAKKGGASFADSLALLRHRSVLGIFLGFFAYDYAWYVYVNWLPGYLVLERRFTPAEMGFYSSVPYVAMSVVILLSGLLSDGLIRRGCAETSVRKALISAGLLVACLIVPAGLVEDRGLAVWLLTGSLCGLGIAAPNTWTLTQAVCAKRIVGTVSGIQNFGGNVGGIIAPALTGYIANRTHSFALALGITGVVLVAGVLSYVLLISRRVDATGPR